MTEAFSEKNFEKILNNIILGKIIIILLLNQILKYITVYLFLRIIILVI